ncbi:PepSY domain-containing protein [Pseudomonas sp. JM0905a]|uniref:PepSY domain-containing protein n=1 Tax=Metapseudomonas resinovorans TaxID=53412 RepID=A0ABT4Y6A7_METRE|nr:MULTISPECIES: PepSY domain-containing protein [Pseudomonas]MBD2838946.1 PepSY domain-containing protein [Pseudomonas sp. JM0905a]MDA8484187.1 PepSY domain-containing protein [Pseudomonas resinovorans]
MRWILRYSGIIALVLAIFALEAMARDLDQDEALKLREEGVIMPLDQLLRSALGLYPGARLLEAELEEEDDVYIYEVELVTADGTVRELELDARDGRILKDEEDD